MRPWRICSVVSMTNAGVAGYPVLVRRVIYRSRVFSFAFDSIWAFSWAVVLVFRLAIRSRSV